MRIPLEDKRSAAVLDAAFRGLTGLAIVAAMFAVVWVAHSSGPDEVASVATGPSSPAALGAQSPASGASSARAGAVVPASHTQPKPAPSTLYSARAARDRVYRSAIAPSTQAAHARTGPTGTNGRL